VGQPSNLGAYPSAGPGGLIFNNSNARLEYNGTNATTGRGFTLSQSGRIILTQTNTTLTMGNCTLNSTLRINGTNGSNSRLVMGDVTVNNITIQTGQGLTGFERGNVTMATVTGADRDLYLMPNVGTDIYVPGTIDLGAGRLYVQDDGTVILEGDNYWSIGTWVQNDSMLVVNNPPGRISSTGQGPVYVQNTASIGGIGRIGAALTVNGNCSVDLRGYGIDVLNLQSFTMADAGTSTRLDLDFDNFGIDSIEAAGAFTLNAGGLRVWLNEVGEVPNGTHDIITWEPVGSSLSGNILFDDGTTNRTIGVTMFELHVDESTGVAQLIVTGGHDWPIVVNDAATDITGDSATLNGELISTGASPTEVWLYWGTNNAGEVRSGWQHTNYFGMGDTGDLWTNVTGLDTMATYYYRFYASNDAAGVWGKPGAEFTTAAPGIPIYDFETNTVGWALTGGWLRSDAETNEHNSYGLVFPVAGASGTAVSDPFTINKQTIQFIVGGYGKDANTATTPGSGGVKDEMTMAQMLQTWELVSMSDYSVLSRGTAPFQDYFVNQGGTSETPYMIDVSAYQGEVVQFVLAGNSTANHWFGIDFIRGANRVVETTSRLTCELPEQSTWTLGSDAYQFVAGVAPEFVSQSANATAPREGGEWLRSFGPQTGTARSREFKLTRQYLEAYTSGFGDNGGGTGNDRDGDTRIHLKRASDDAILMTFGHLGGEQWTNHVYDVGAWSYESVYIFLDDYGTGSTDWNGIDDVRLTGEYFVSEGTTLTIR
jgi:hypothetical protein